MKIGRNEDGAIDTVSSASCSLHLEQCADGLWSLSVKEGEDDWLLEIRSATGRARVSCAVIEGPEDVR